MNNTFNNSFLIQAEDGKKLREAQIQFNENYSAMTIEQEKLQQFTTELDGHLAYYEKEIKPIVVSCYDARKAILKMLFTFYERAPKKMGLDEHEFLGAIIDSQMSQLLLRDRHPDPEFKTMFKVFKGKDFDQNQAESLAESKVRLVHNLRGFGYEISDDAFAEAHDFDELNNIFTRVLNELERSAEAFKDESDPAGLGKENLAEEIKQEAALKALKNKYIENIYPTLAALFKPDDKDDAEMKAEKASSLKTLSAAYKLKQAYPILNLELNWMHLGGNSTADLPDEKLHIYNEILNDRTTQLKSQLIVIQSGIKYGDMYEVNEFEDITKPKLKEQGARYQRLMDSMNSLTTLLASDDDRAIEAARSIMDFENADSLMPDQVEPYLLGISNEKGGLAELEALFNR